METEPGDNADAQALDPTIRQNAIWEGMIGFAPFELGDPFLIPKAVGTGVLAEVMRPLPTETSE